jgi:hypothetical protein
MRWAETRKSQTRQVGAYTTKRLLRYLAKPPITGEQARPDGAAKTAEQEPATHKRTPRGPVNVVGVQHPGTGAGKYLSPAVECQREASPSLETALWVYASGVNKCPYSLSRE